MPGVIPAFAAVAGAVRDFRESTGLEETSTNNFLPTMSFHLLTCHIEGELVSLEVSGNLSTGNVPLPPRWGNGFVELVGRVLPVEFKVACATIQHFSSKLLPMWGIVGNSRTSKQGCSSSSCIPLVLVLAHLGLLSLLCMGLCRVKCSVGENCPRARGWAHWKYVNFHSAFQSVTSLYL